MTRERHRTEPHDAHDDRPLAVVVDPLPAERQRVAEALRRAGFDTIEASTPLEAIDVIEQPERQIEAVAIRDLLTQTAGEELASFLAEHHPAVQLALLSGRRRGAATTASGRRVPVVAIDDDISGPVRIALRPDAALANK